uniref:uncharacterized protein LOC117609785 isoform X1 n=1 Tax=Osmia lignaria TaxID=473952 RepID=UPI0014796FE1|nr:uncharacterized protein LOC117609785 isoform X1 [Osmia lignaria]
MNAIMMFMVVVGLCAAMPQYYIPEGFVYPHPANLLNSAVEDTLPNELRNDFYKNPIIAAKLAKESWIFNKEMQPLGDRCRTSRPEHESENRIAPSPSIFEKHEFLKKHVFWGENELLRGN